MDSLLDNSSLVDKFCDLLLVDLDNMFNFFNKMNNRLFVDVDCEWSRSDWFNVDWMSQLMNSVSQVNNLLVNSLDCSLQDNNLLSDDRSLWLRSDNKFLFQDNNLVMNLNDLLS